MSQENASNRTNRNVWNTFSINISAIVLVFVIGVFIGLIIRNRGLIEKEILFRARSHFHSILLTRRWNANYNGVYVEKKEGMQSNPYLENPDIETKDGKIYTKKNPALMTREISEIAKQAGLLQFHITSLNPLNPGNAPDEFETDALKSFETGETERFTKTVQNGQYLFRYMAPLFVEDSCMACHAKQGYKPGNVRGGISVSFDITNVERTLKSNTYIIVSLAALTLILMLGTIYFFTIRLMKQLTEAQQELERFAVTDPLTQLYNRRYFFQKLQEEFSRAKRYDDPLSCLMIDLDFFKKINDRYGHQAGDTVLKEVSKVMKQNLRANDTLARYGGEEFIIFLPEADRVSTLLVAEKIRRVVEEMEIPIEDTTKINVTVSIGSFSLTPAMYQDVQTIDQIIEYADQALLKAKEKNRNRVEIYELG